LHGHSPPIIHRDLNSRNVLLDKDMTAVVADLGLSRFKDEQQMTNAVGMLPWIAPEVFRGETYCEKADVYSFAMLLFELLTAREPHTSGPQEITSVRFATLAAYNNHRPTLPSTVSPFWCELIQSCWIADAKQRPAFSFIQEQIRRVVRDLPSSFSVDQLTSSVPPMDTEPVYLNS